MLYDFRMTVLDSVSFHVVLWIMITVGLVGNALVIVWRCTRPRPQRGSVLSIAIIILAVADLLYCVHLGMLEGSVAREVFGGLNFINASDAMNVICRISGNLSLLSCSTAMWMTLNIAIYSCQVLTGCNCCCNCCSLVARKGCLFVTVVCQLLFTSLPIIGINIYLMDYWGDGFVLPLPGQPVTASEVLSTCAYAQTASILQLNSICFEWNCSNWTNPSTCDWVTFACSREEPDIEMFYIVTTLVSLNSLLSVSCAVLYLTMCIRLNRQFHTPSDVPTMRSQGVTELTKLKWRLTLIVLINTGCWITVTTIHVYLLYYPGEFGEAYILELIATSFVLVSISPAINPLIYTIAGKQFVKFLKRCWKFLKCQVTIGRTRELKYDDYLIEVRRCSCIPCVQCIKPRDLDTWNTEEASLFSSDDEHEHSDSTPTN